MYPNLPRTDNRSGISSGVVANQTNVSTAQVSQLPNFSNASILKRNSSSLSESERALKKKKIDQAYRERCKVGIPFPFSLFFLLLEFGSCGIEFHAIFILVF